MGPFKCPDCGIWWAGFEHRCLPGINTTVPFPGDTTSLPIDWCSQCRMSHKPGVHINTTTLTHPDVSGTTGPKSTGWSMTIEGAE